MEQPGSSQVPLPRLPTVVTTGLAHFLPLCVPGEPSNGAASAAGTATQTQTQQPSAALLHAVCGALLGADTSHIQPRLPAQPLAAQPGTLEHALVELNPLVFRSQAGHQHHAAAPSPGGQQRQAKQPQQKQQRKQAGAHTPSSSGKARPASAAAAAAAGAAGEGAEAEHAAKRRKTIAPSDEEYVSRTVDGQQVAAAVAEQIASFMQQVSAAAAAAPAAQLGDASADEPAAPASAGKRPRKAGARAAGGGSSKASQQQQLAGAASMELLKQLQSSLAAGKQAGILSQLDQEQLRQLLLLLLDQVRLGQDQLIEEQDTASSASAQAVNTALEAACCCLQVLSAAGMHNSLYMDELMTAAVSTAKYQLQYNVLALHDPQYKRLYRPAAAAAAAESAPLPSAGKRKSREPTGARPPKVLGDVRAKLELLLSLLAQTVGRIVLEVELLLPLVRIALTCLSVDSLQVLQAQAVALAVAVFRAYPEQRESLANEVLATVVGRVHIAGAGKAPARLFEATGPALEPLPVMMATALLVQLVQVSVELPDMDAESAAIRVGFRAAFGWSDFLWRGIFDRLPAAKAAKTEGATDFKLVVQALLADLVTVQMLPEWPAANILLRRFIKQLASESIGLKHKDAAVKLACVEFTGQLATALCLEALAADREADEVQGVKEAARAAADPDALQAAHDQLHQLPDLLLLDYLAAAGGSSSSSSDSSSDSSNALVSARQFVCCRMLHDAIHADAAEAAAKQQQELTLLLVQHRKLQDSSQLSVLGDAVSGQQQQSRGQVVALLRQSVMQGPLGRARVAMIKWLLEAGSRTGPDPSPATVRTKVFKCLGTVVEADSRVMALAEVAAAMHAAQEDDSAAVKEAVLELLVKLIGTNPELAGQYFDTLVSASYDQGVMVRKRAIRALWECCSCPGFSRADDAVVAVLQRANDKEDSMKSLVTKICGEMWFTEASSFAGLSDADAAAAAAAGSSAVRTAAVRAAELAGVSLRLYEAGGRTIHLPLPPDHGLVVILREVLGTGGSGSAAALASAPSAKELKEQAHLREGAAEVAQALLEMILQQHQQETDDSLTVQDSSSSSASSGCFQHLLALHALTAADPSVAVPAADAQRFVRCLAPYVSELSSAVALGRAGRMSSAGAGGAGVSEDASRRAAEEGVSLMCVLDAVLTQLGCIEADVGQQLALDIVSMLAKQRYLPVIAAGCQLLCTLAGMHAPSAEHVPLLVQRVYEVATLMLSCGQQQGTLGTIQRAPRALFLMGQLCRHGAAILDAAAARDTKNHSCAECLEICVSLWHRTDLPADALRTLRESALSAVGLVIIGRPGLLLQPLQLRLLEHQHSAALPANSAHSRGSGDAGSPSNNGNSPKQLAAQGSGLVLPGVLSGVNVVRVYTSVLSDPGAAMAMKSRVLTNLVELLRAEEATVLTRQKEAEAAGAAGRLPSTLPAAAADAKAPLARVNGANDAAGGSGSSSIIQCVWTDVLRLATGVAAGGLEAANTRRRALELIEVVLRGGLVAPWDAVPPLVAQLTDELPDTRAAALRVLKSASDKYTEYVAQQLPLGVLEAFSFQSRLWDAKHPGQPLPRGPSAEVLDSLSAMYSDIVQPSVALRQTFLKALLKPFRDACNIAAPPLAAAAAREDPCRLAFCAYVAASLPFKRADEPLVLLHVINGCVSQMAQEARDVLRRCLLRLGLRERMGLDDDDDDDEDEAGGADANGAGANGAAAAESQQADAAASPQHHPRAKQQPQQPAAVSLPLPVPLPAWLGAPLRASLGLSMLLVLKQYLMAAYSLSDERVAQYELKGERARAEAKATATRNRRTGDFGLSVLHLRCVTDGTGELLAGQFKTFAALLDNDAANYREAAVLAALDDDGDDEEAGEAAAAAAGGHGGNHPTTTPAAASAGLVVYSMEAKTRSTRGRGGGAAGRGSAGRASTGGGRGTGRGRASTGGRSTTGRGGSKKTGKRKKARFSADSSEDEDDGAADSGDEEWGGSASKAAKAKARKLFH